MEKNVNFFLKGHLSEINFYSSSLKFKVLKKINFYYNNDLNFFKYFLYSYNVKFDRKFFKSAKRFIDLIYLFFGINRRLFKNLLNIFGFSINFNFSNISMSEFFFFWLYISDLFFFHNRLKFFIKTNLKFKIFNGCYMGKRLRQGLPTKGQRTKSNGKTSKKFRLNSIFFEKSTKLEGKKKK